MNIFYHSIYRYSLSTQPQVKPMSPHQVALENSRAFPHFFFFSFEEFTYHKINHFRVYNSVLFSIATMFCNHLLYLVSKISTALKENPTYYAIIPCFLLPQTVHTSIYSLSLDFLVLDGSRKWNHIVCDLSYLLSLTLNKAFEISPYCSMQQSIYSFL